MQLCFPFPPLPSFLFCSTNDMFQAAIDRLWTWLLVQVAMGVICACLRHLDQFAEGNFRLYQPARVVHLNKVIDWKAAQILAIRFQSSAMLRLSCPDWSSDGHYTPLNAVGGKGCSYSCGWGKPMQFPLRRRILERGYMMNAIKIRSEVEIV